jgi:hypothetical protein
MGVNGALLFLFSQFGVELAVCTGFGVNFRGEGDEPSVG